MPAVAVAGRTACYGTGGVAWRDGQPHLLMVHGAGMDHSAWALQARSLAQRGWNVAAVDLPGHGRSADRAELTSVEAYAGWLESFATAIGAESYGLVGHSLGACICIDLAARVGDRVIGLALLGAGESMPVNDELLADAAGDPSRAHRFIAAFGHHRGAHLGGSEAPGVWLLGAALALLERCAPEVLHRDFAACNVWRGAELAASVVTPTTVISAAGDRMTPPRAGAALVELIDGATHTVLAGGGHMMTAEAPRDVNRALRSFFGPLRGSPRALACATVRPR